MPVLDASSLIALSAEENKRKVSWTVALTLLELVMSFDPVAILRQRIKDGMSAEIPFFSYIDTTAHIDDWEKMTQCHMRDGHGRATFQQLFTRNADGITPISLERLDLCHLPLGDLLHHNSKRSCALMLLGEMLGPNFRIRSRVLYGITKSSDYEDLGCHVCPAKWHRVALYLEFVPHALPRNDYLLSLWPNLGSFKFVKPQISYVNTAAPIMTMRDEWRM